MITRNVDAIVVKGSNRGREFIAAEKREGPQAYRTFEGASPSRRVLRSEHFLAGETGVPMALHFERPAPGDVGPAPRFVLTNSPRQPIYL